MFSILTGFRGRSYDQSLGKMFVWWGRRLINRLSVPLSRTPRTLTVGTGFSLTFLATKAVHAEGSATELKSEGLVPLDFSQIPQQSSHSFLLSQSSVLCVEAASRTLHHSVVALQEIATSYSTHISELAALLELGGDGLPLAYTSAEIYDKMVDLKSDLKREKQQLADLNLLFGCCKRVLENAGETAFLVGAEFSALQAGERVASAERAVQQSLHTARVLEGYLQGAERKHIERAGKAEEAMTRHKDENAEEQHLNPLPSIPPPPNIPPPPELHDELNISTYEMLVSDDIKASNESKAEDKKKSDHSDDGLLIEEERQGEGFRPDLEERELLTEGRGIKEEEPEEGTRYRLPTF